MSAQALSTDAEVLSILRGSGEPMTSDEIHAASRLAVSVDETATTLGNLRRAGAIEQIWCGDPESRRYRIAVETDAPPGEPSDSNDIPSEKLTIRDRLLAAFTAPGDELSRTELVARTGLLPKRVSDGCFRLRREGVLEQCENGWRVRRAPAPDVAEEQTPPPADFAGESDWRYGVVDDGSLIIFSRLDPDQILELSPDDTLRLRKFLLHRGGPL